VTVKKKITKRQKPKKWCSF